MGNEGSQPLKYGERLDNNISVKWKKLDVEHPFPSRESHCACSLKNHLYVFGGVIQSAQSDGEPIESNDLLAFDLESNCWSLLEKNGSVPAPRSGASMIAVKEKLYMFGGLSRETGWFNDIHVYDTVTKCWTMVEDKGKKPSPRDKLASAVIKDRIYYFGGFGPNGMEEDELDEESDEEDTGAQFGWFNDLYIFDTASSTWSSPVQMNVCTASPRAAHAMCSIDKYLIIFGGKDCNGRTNDIHIFDTETRKWMTDLKAEGRQPEPRSFHSCTAVGSRVVISGGRGMSDQHFKDFHIFDTASRKWLQPKISGTEPEGRGTHTINVVGDSIVMYGGSSDFKHMFCHKVYSDLHVIKADDVTKGNAILNEADNQENISSNVIQHDTNAKDEDIKKS